MKPSDVSALGLSIPSKHIKHLSSRGGVFPIKGKYGLVNLGDDGDDESLLVGPNYFTQARLSEKIIESDSDFENDRAEIDDADERELSRPSNTDSEDEKEDSIENIDKNGERQVEPVENSQSLFGLEYGNNLFPPTYDGIYNFLPNPYLPPFNFNIPIPIINQYLQRKAFNSALRYPSLASQYPGGYEQNQRQYNANSPSFTPFTRYFYVQ